MNTVAIVQARMGSTRLPGKVLLELAGAPMLAQLVRRLRACQRLDRLVVATTDQLADQPIAELCRELGVAVFKGSEHDVLLRYHVAAEQFEADTVVRLTADCPLIDPRLVDRLCELFEGGSFDYVSNCLTRSFPRGLDAEVFSLNALRTAHREASSPWEREHVTPFIYQNPHRFALGELRNSEDLSRYRWTVDTEDDFRFVSQIYAALFCEHSLFSTEEVLDLLQRRPELLEINASVQQRTPPKC